MRLVTALLAIALILGVFSPVTIALNPNDGKTILISLDVCHAHSSGALYSADAPCMAEHGFEFMPEVSCAPYIAHPLNNTFFLLSQACEIPPEALS